jgi:hypothetical protein
MGKKVTIEVDVTELGRKGGRARAANLTATERSRAASVAARARWENYRREHPQRKIQEGKKKRGEKEGL